MGVIAGHMKQLKKGHIAPIELPAKRVEFLKNWLNIDRYMESTYEECKSSISSIIVAWRKEFPGDSKRSDGSIFREIIALYRKCGGSKRTWYGPYGQKPAGLGNVRTDN